MTDDLKARGVRVRKLVWDGNFAVTPWGGYSIGSAAGPDHSYDWFDWRHSSRGDYDTSDDCWATEEEAKAAAQTDYAARILAALELDPAALSDHPAVKALVAEAVAAERERCIAIAVRHWEGEPEDTIAMAAEMRVGMENLSDYDRKVAQMREDFPNGI